MRAAVVAVALVLVTGLAPGSAWAQDVRGGMSTPPPGSTPHPPHRPGPPFPVFPCCLGFSYVTPEPPPPVIVVPPPPVVYVVPSPPSLAYVPTPRPEPAPEIVLPTGRWARHGNGKEYPYTWVWVGPAPAR